MDKIIIIGGKGSAVTVAEQIFDTQQKRGGVEFLGFAFDDESFGTEINGFPILCKTYDAYKTYETYEDVKFLFQLYRPDLMRERIALRESYKIPIQRWANFIHHSVYIANSAQIGYGNIFTANTVVNSNAVIGSHNTFHANVLVGHNTKIGDNNFVAAHCAIGSNNNIEDGNFIGLNVSINNYVQIGSYNFIGMASNVIKGLTDNMNVYGNPAKPFEGKVKPL